MSSAVPVKRSLLLLGLLVLLLAAGSELRSAVDRKVHVQPIPLCQSLLLSLLGLEILVVRLPLETNEIRVVDLVIVLTSLLIM